MRHVVEDEHPLPAHVGVVVLLVFRDESVDAAGEPKAAADDIAADAQHGFAHGLRLGAAEGISLSVVLDFDCRAGEDVVQFEELLREPLDSVEIAAEVTHPFDELWPRSGVADSGKPVREERKRLLVSLHPRRRFAEYRRRVAPGAFGWIRAEEFLPIPDEFAVGVDEAPDVLAVHRKGKGVGERAAGGGVGAPEDRKRDAGELLSGAVVVHYLHAAVEPQLQREAPRDAHEEAIEGADLREVLGGDDLAQQRRAGRVALRPLGEQRDEALEDLARRRAREGQRDDLVRLQSALDERDQPLGQRLRLAGPGRRLDKDVLRHEIPPFSW